MSYNEVNSEYEEEKKVNEGQGKDNIEIDISEEEENYEFVKRIFEGGIGLLSLQFFCIE